MVPAAATVLVVARAAADVAALAEWLPTVEAVDLDAVDAPLVELDVVYDGDDLDDVAAATGLGVDDVVGIHSGATYRCEFCGFAPGFAYLAGLDPALVLSRRATPRTRVPAGAVAIANEYTAVYPSPSPGGWQLLGRTSAPLWDPTRPEPALIHPGVGVRFRPVTSLPAPPPIGTPAAARGGSLLVVTPGIATTVQDRGRPGHAAIGVTTSGALDPGRLALVNRLVGNGVQAAALETAGGLVVEALEALVVADAASGTVATLRPGDRIGVDPAGEESWTYLAVRGGLAVEAALGSRSSDTLGGVGPPPPAPGTVLPVGPDPQIAITVDPAPPPPRAPEVHVRLGPRADWFAPSAMDALLRATWTVTAERSRVGVRLAGPELPREDAFAGVELPSEGLVTGAIQVPHDGQPIVMLADHPTTGGYPVIAVVEPADVATVAQAPGGTTLRFRRAR